jgi:hypothetical protein
MTFWHLFFLFSFSNFQPTQSGQITVLANQKVEDEVVDAGCFTAEAWEQAKIWTA